jgi:hypothetical protein
MKVFELNDNHLHQFQAGVARCDGYFLVGWLVG